MPNPNRRPHMGAMSQKQQVYQKFGDRCFYCGDTVERKTIDHVVPLSKGGQNVKENMVVSCVPCNSEKGNQTPTRTQMYCLQFFWGKSLIPEDKWEDLELGRWTPAMVPGRTLTRRLKLWHRDKRCKACGCETVLPNEAEVRYEQGSMVTTLLDNSACLSNTFKGQPRVIYCWNCIKKRDRHPDYRPAIDQANEILQKLSPLEVAFRLLRTPDGTEEDEHHGRGVEACLVHGHEERLGPWPDDGGWVEVWRRG